MGRKYKNQLFDNRPIVRISIKNYNAYLNQKNIIENRFRHHTIPKKIVNLIATKSPLELSYIRTYDACEINNKK